MFARSNPLSLAISAAGRHDWNDLAKWPKSLWRVSLAGKGGRQVLPVKIVVDKRTPAELRSWFPDHGPFHKAYVVTFPRASADGTPIVPADAEAMTLTVASALGGVELSWRAK